MGVYIKGMEMPTNDDMNPTAVWVYPNGYVAVFNDNGNRMQYTKAVPVPPHGRLVGADKLMQEMRLFINENMLLRDDARELLETIESAPTVLEAEEGEA